MRTLGACALAGLFLVWPVFAADAPTKKQIARQMSSIYDLKTDPGLKIVPGRATVESTVRLQLGDYREVEGALKEFKPTIYFDDKRASLEEVEATTLVVEVPAGIGVRPVITVSLGKLNFRQESGFSVIPQIDSVDPETAPPGSKVMLIPDVILGSDSKVEVFLFSTPLEVLETGTRSVVVRLPDSVSTAKPELALHVDGVSGQPFRGLAVGESVESKSFLDRYWPVVGGAVILGAILVIVNDIIRRRSRRRRVREIASAAPRPVDSELEPPYAGPPVPEIPEKLARAIATQSCVLFAGGGLSVAAGFPTWARGLDDLLERAAEAQSGDQLSPKLLKSLKGATPYETLDLLAARMGADFVYTFVEQVYGREVKRLPKLASTLSSLPFAGVITTNWDDVMTKCFRSRGRARLATEWEQLQRLFSENEFFLVKLHGDPNDRDSLVLTPSDYGRVLERNVPLKRFMMSLYAEKSFLFLGSSLSSIEQFLVELTSDSTELPHYALVPYERDFERHQARFAGKYHVELLGYRPSEAHLEVLDFVEQLRKSVDEAQETLPKTTENLTPWLRRVVLHNIGAFENLELDLERSWNVLLGDNGCGKSTILRAIALGLCGPDDRVGPLAANLLRHKTTRGSVELTIGTQSFMTELVREGSRIRVVNPERYTPLESGKWLALGFPSMRGVSNVDPTEASKEIESRAPAADDLLPLLAGDIDTRMNDFKQWIYNAYLRSTSDGSEELKRIFSFLESMTPGVKLEFAGIDPDTMKIMVKTDDGEVPLELLSQGTSSVIGWAGTLLQRLQAVYRGKGDRAGQPALVVVDELAAHMHPAWQYSLAGLVRNNFENLQIVVATHSPLVLGSIEDGTIFRIKRTPEEGIEVTPTAKPLYGWLAEDIYEFMGLDDTRAEGFRARLNTFKQLDSMRVKGAASTEQLQKLDELREDLEHLPGTDPVSLTMELENLGELLEEESA